MQRTRRRAPAATTCGTGTTTSARRGRRRRGPVAGPSSARCARRPSRGRTVRDPSPGARRTARRACGRRRSRLRGLSLGGARAPRRSRAARPRGSTSRRPSRACPRAACRSSRSGRSRRAAAAAGRRASPSCSSWGPGAGRSRPCRHALVVAHPEQRDHLHGDHAARKRGLAHADHRVERVAVLAERLGDEAVVCRIDDRQNRKRSSLSACELLVPLVLVARSPWGSRRSSGSNRSWDLRRYYGAVTDDIARDSPSTRSARSR